MFSSIVNNSIKQLFVYAQLNDQTILLIISIK